MTDFIGFVWRRHRLLGLITLVALVAALIFAVDFLAEAVYFADPAHRDRPVEPWMSLRYVERSWGLPRPILFEIIGHDGDTPREAVPRSVGQALRDTGMTLPEFQAMVEEAQRELRARRGR
ncbi:hypothetical protein [Limimaricola cinnabarinus]|uniref:Uncharacterized protein n=1 Tax=Limimaricola cinnabarinus LL-001 TaxID=1337093 RepID=U2Z6Z9_9RHOB|nr:hypothetical protein [Limimaricola cinnabarinus]GAD56807.1 hypothetical protein MBELCI_2859 [Limimaricola cinnabarinus LL-001]